MPRLARIALYPVKSLDPVTVDAAELLPCGALKHDRQFALVDVAGRFVNGKRTDLVHRLEARCHPAERTVLLGARGSGGLRLFHLDDDREALEEVFSQHFGRRVQLVENAETGLPDDTEAPGPTVISTATLETVASWFGNMSLDEARLRFRANLEIDGVEPFWEERLYGVAGEGVRFTVGSVALEGTNPCARCIVPMRHPAEGALDPDFKRVFMERRPATLPEWAERSRFDHYYRLAINTRPVTGRTAGRVRVGDPVALADG